MGTVESRRECTVQISIETTMGDVDSATSEAKEKHHVRFGSLRTLWVAHGRQSGRHMRSCRIERVTSTRMHSTIILPLA